jgi:hypothetical protein
MAAILSLSFCTKPLHKGGRPYMGHLFRGKLDQSFRYKLGH